MILDIIFVAFVLLFAIIGLVRGFARQIFSLASKLVSLIAAYFLLMPIYNLLYDMFLGSIVESIGSSLASLTFLDTYAATFGKNTGTLLAEYVTLLVLFVVISIAVGIVLKILKKIVYPICDLKGIRFFDRVFGLALGAAFGLLIPCAVLYLATIAAGWSFMPANLATTITDLIASLSKDSFLSEEYIIANLDKVELFFSQIWDLLRKGFDMAKSA